jgi:hypothetical protein
VRGRIEEMVRARVMWEVRLQAWEAQTAVEGQGGGQSMEKRVAPAAAAAVIEVDL